MQCTYMPSYYSTRTTLVSVYAPIAVGVFFFVLACGNAIYEVRKGNRLAAEMQTPLEREMQI